MSSMLQVNVRDKRLFCYFDAFMLWGIINKKVIINNSLIDIFYFICRHMPYLLYMLIRLSPVSHTQYLAVRNIGD